MIKCLDFEKAFDSINREILWKILNSYGHDGIPEKLVQLIQTLYTDFRYIDDVLPLNNSKFVLCWTHLSHRTRDKGYNRYI